jgi:ABC-type antimicrobial peptide transport system permease subunit
LFSLKVKTNIFSGKYGMTYVREGAGSVAVIRIYVSVEPEPKEIVNAPQHWFLPVFVVLIQ